MKMTAPTVSVIIPVYNVSQYLARCVESILSQDYADMEIILVDDGSTDDSGRLCDEFAQRDDRVRVIHQENGGQSSARNTAIDAMRGEYVCFIDGDDFIEPGHISTLMRLVEQYSADIAVGGLYNCYETYRSPQCAEEKEFCCDGAEALKKMLEGVEVSGSPCCKLIRRALVDGRYFIVGKTYEDAFYLPELLLAAERVAVTTIPLYNYWHRSDSTTTKPFNERAMDVIDAYVYTKQLVEDRRLTDLASLAAFRLWWAHFVVLDRMLLVPHYRRLPQYRGVVSCLKKDWYKILRCAHFQKSRRIAAVALKVNVACYRLLSVLKAKRDGIHQ